MQEDMDMEAPVLGALVEAGEARVLWELMRLTA